MAQKNINIGSSANKGDGDPLRTAFSKAEDNFTELYSRLVTVEAQAGIANPGGAVIQQSIIGSVIGEDSTTIIDHATSTIIANKITGDLTGSVVADDSTVLIDGVSGTINAGALTGALPAIDGSALTGITTLNGQAASYYLDFANFTNTPTTLAGYGITDGLQLGTSATTALAGNTTFSFADITSKPTTLSGYGITDGNSLTDVTNHLNGSLDNNIIPDTNTTYDLGSTTNRFKDAYIQGTVTIGTGSISSTEITNWNTAYSWGDHSLAGYLTSFTETDPVVGAITGLVKSDGAGNISAAVAGTDYLTTVAFADLTGKPTTLAGYGITDALASGGALTGSSLDTNTIQTSSGNLAISADNYVQINSDNDGQIEIGTASGQGNVLIGNETNGTQVSIFGEMFIRERARFFKGAEEQFETLTGSTGVTTMDCANGHIHYLTGASGDITANFTNLGLTAEYATNLTVIINQGATPYEVTAVQIGGAAQTINWQGGSAPTGNANGIDSFSFTILNDGGSYVVLGQMVDFT